MQILEEHARPEQWDELHEFAMKRMNYNRMSTMNHKLRRLHDKLLVYL